MRCNRKMRFVLRTGILAVHLLDCRVSTVGIDCIIERPIYAGNAIQTVQITDKKRVITVRSTAFSAERRGMAARRTYAAGGADERIFSLTISRLPRR